MKRSLYLCILLLLLVSLLPTTAYAVTTVDTVTITNIATPVDGNGIYPGATAGSNAYQVYEVEWYNVTDSKFMSVGDTFAAGKVYRADVWIEANSGYEFKYKDSQTPGVSVTLNGRSVPAQKAYEYAPWAMIVASYTFDPCPKKEISHVDIELGTVAEGEYVPFSLQNQPDKVVLYPNLHTRFYPYGFHWSNFTTDTDVAKGGKFMGGCEYYVSIALRPQYDSYVFTDNFTATINGKAATIKDLTETSVIVEVSLTCYGAITYADIAPVITLPKTGEIPDFSVYYAYPQCKHIAYANPLVWYDVQTGTKLTTSDTFRAGRSYRAELTLLADYPYKFRRDANDKMEYAPYLTGEHVDEYVFGWDSYRGRETITLKKTYTMPEAAHTHTPSGWRTTQVYHYKACTTCGEFLEQDDHSGGTATCSQKGNCTVCGYAYLPENEDHTPDTKWTACAGLYHAKLCTLCGAHCTPEDHKPGSAATDDTPQTCTVCKYVIVPAKNHKHQMKAVEANAPTCTHTGNSAYYMCTDCEGLYADKAGKTPLTDSVLLPALGHTPSDVWGVDDAVHWLVCTTCNTVMEETKAHHEIAGDQCTVCGYKKGSQTDPEPTEPVPGETGPGPEPTEPVPGETGPGPDATEAVPHPTEDGNGAVVLNIGAAAPEPEKAFSIGLMIALGAVFFAAAVTVTVIILKKKKQ